MTWADALPNLLIGLREGLEGGLVVSILLAALRKTATADDRRPSSAPVWLGVLGALMLAGSFAAILTFSTRALPTRAQEAIGGVLSVLAVGLVTAMVFWMRRTAASLSQRLRGDVAKAITIGAGALTLTAFLAVGREGLETTLFIWTAVKASGETVAPVAGAAVGFAAAVTLCWLLYRQSVRINLGVFFSRTALALIVVAAGVLSYGLGDLQEAGLLPGRSWVAFDLTGHVDPSSWWMSILSGVTELTPRMTVLQVVGWLGFLAVVIPAFMAAKTLAPVPAAATPAAAGTSPQRSWWERLVARRPWQLATGLVVVPASVALAAIVALPASGDQSTAVSFDEAACASGWTAATAGEQAIAVRNNSGTVAEVTLDDASGHVVAEIETIGPGTTAAMHATLGDGVYRMRCLLPGRPALTSDAIVVEGPHRAAPRGVQPVSMRDLSGPNTAYQRYAAHQLRLLAADVRRIAADLSRGDRSGARADWLAAQLRWERVGASYNSFGDIGVAIDGLPDGLPRGAHDAGFTGLHRLEWGLFHREPTPGLLAVTDRLRHDITTLRATLTSDDVAGDPANLPLRAHEILEDAQRDHLSGNDDQGAGAGFAETYADVQVTRVVVHELAPLLRARDGRLVAQVDRQLDALSRALLGTRAAGRWAALEDVPVTARQDVNAAIGATLETLARVPNLLELPATR